MPSIAHSSVAVDNMGNFLSKKQKKLNEKWGLRIAHNNNNNPEQVIKTVITQLSSTVVDVRMRQVGSARWVSCDTENSLYIYKVYKV